MNIEEILEEIWEAAPETKSVIGAARLAASRLGLEDVKDSTMRGWWKGKPDFVKEVKSRLKNREQPHVTITGVTASETLDEDEIWDQMVEMWEKRREKEERRRNQKINVSHGPFCLTFMADLHLGNSGVDYPRLIDECQIINSMPSTGLVVVGDMLDNFILGRMRQIRDNDSIDITHEWILVKKILGIIAPSLTVVVDGNHDQWTQFAAGFDYLRDVVAQIRPDVIYGKDEALVDLEVGDMVLPGKIRHQWNGNSQWNDTHGIEKAGKFEREWVWGVGAHTHRSGLARGFNMNGKSGLAILCGSYKRYDSYATRLGLGRANHSTAVSMIVIPETNSFIGVEDLETAAYIMESMY